MMCRLAVLAQDAFAAGGTGAAAGSINFLHRHVSWYARFSLMLSMLPVILR
jgi:hypothetical protein